MLQCIDAVNNLKRLKLANCTKITGTCLEPLRGSLIIEQIDLSLVGEHQNPDLDPPPPISCDHVLPILDSIVANEGCSLMHLQFPSMWRKDPSIHSEFHAFLGRYNQMYRSRGVVTCLECNESLPRGEIEIEWIQTVENVWYGTHGHTCYGCFKHYCYDCDSSIRFMIQCCYNCKRDYCKECLEMTECMSCRETNCNDCCLNECSRCNSKICSPCVQSHEGCNECADCKGVLCLECQNLEGGVCVCEECFFICCSDCRLQRFRHGQQECSECIKKIAHLLLDESIVYSRLIEENKSLKVENDELKRENKELRSRN
ncbi:hypothetical protein ACHAWT_000606 [Skeletonema menzelii]